MSISAIGGAASSHYAGALPAAQTSPVAKAPTTTASPVDSDGDRDGSTPAAGRLDVKA